MTTSTPPVARLGAVSFDCPDPGALAGFYAPLLGMREVFASPDGGFVALTDGRLGVTFQRTEDHVPPSWPDAGQLQQVHLDLAVTDLEEAVERAVALGARVAEHQPRPDAWRVLLDPAGHPFCLTSLIPDFAALPPA